MKKLLVIPVILFLTLTSVSGQTNVYHPFPTHDAIWKEEIHSYIPQTTAMSCKHYQNEIAGDTTVGSYLYHKLRSRGYSWPYWYCGNPYYTPAYFDGYIGAFRQDSALKKVYFLQPGQATDTLLLDFDLHLGDTLPKTYNNYQTGFLTVTLVDSVLINGSYRRRFGISGYGFGGPDTNFVYLVEGIGSTFGLINLIHTSWEVPNGSSLECFMLNGLTVYPDTGFNCSLVSINEYERNASPEVTISPNPFSNSTQISLNRNYQNISLELYDIQGKLMMQNEYADCDKIILNRNGLNNGMYFLRITLDGKWVETRKMLVSE